MPYPTDGAPRLKEESSKDDNIFESFKPRQRGNQVENSRPTLRNLSEPDRLPLGLLNGRYEIECPDLEKWQWSSSDFSLVLTIDGTCLWGAYDFGMFKGIIRLLSRPYSAGNRRFNFTWRGRDNSKGENSFGPFNEGWMRFLGGGRIEGMINCYGDVKFTGR